MTKKGNRGVWAALIKFGRKEGVNRAGRLRK